MYEATPLGMRPCVVNEGARDRVALEALTIYDAGDEGILAKGAVGEKAHLGRERRPYAYSECEAKPRAVGLRACGTEAL